MKKALVVVFLICCTILLWRIQSRVSRLQSSLNEYARVRDRRMDLVDKDFVALEAKMVDAGMMFRLAAELDDDTRKVRHCNPGCLYVGGKLVACGDCDGVVQ